MNTAFWRGICIGALAGAAAEMAMLTASASGGTRPGNTVRAMGNTMGSAVDDVVDRMSHPFPAERRGKRAAFIRAGERAAGTVSLPLPSMAPLFPAKQKNLAKPGKKMAKMY